MIINLILLNVLIIFLSTNNLNANVYTVKNIQIKEPYDLNFKKKKVIEKAFISAFEILVSKKVSSKDLNISKTTNINLIKPMIDSFLISNEKFKDNYYSAEFEVFFNKKKILNYLNSLNIVSSIPKDKQVLFIPIFINLLTDEIYIYDENLFYLNWEKVKSKNFLLNYIIPDEDLDDFNIIKKNITDIENYDFKEIIPKYNQEDYVVAIFFQNSNKLKILSKIFLKNNLNIISSFEENVDFNDDESIKKIIYNLKVNYENLWKKENEINISIKSPINISIETKNLKLINMFEEKLQSSQLVYDYRIEKFDNKNTIYNIIYNSTPDKFLNDFSNDFNINISENIWEVK